MSTTVQPLKMVPDASRTFQTGTIGSTNFFTDAPGRSARRNLESGYDLFRPGEQCSGIYYLTGGCIFLYDLLEDGRRQILHFALPGALLGLYPNRITIYGAQALTEAAVRVISHELLESLLKSHPKLALQLMWSVWRERNLAYDHLTSVGRRSSRERIARLLLELYVRFRLKWPRPDTQEMHLPLTQEHVGDATGLTNVHVNRVLRRLRHEGIVEFHYRRLRILDPDKLVDVAGVNPGIAVWGCKDEPHEGVVASLVRSA